MFHVIKIDNILSIVNTYTYIEVLESGKNVEVLFIGEFEKCEDFFNANA